MKIRAVLAALPLIALAACGTAGTGTAGTASTSPTGSNLAEAGTGTAPSVPSSAAATLGPELPPATAVADPVQAAGLPTVTGAFGEKPSIAFPDSDPVPSLQRVVLEEGDGAVAAVGDLVVVNYYGVVWGGTEPFDNSFDRGEAFNFTVGGGVINGWSVGLEGVPAGSRILLSIPPEDGYGAQGSGANIPGGSTLAFVVDVIGVFPPDAAVPADATAEPQDPALPQVAGPVDEQPTVTVPADAQEPTEVVVKVINKGTGAPIEAGQVVVQMFITDWVASGSQSTWPTEENIATGAQVGPQVMPIEPSADAAAVNPLASLIGVPAGSRVLLLIPGTPADAATGAAATSATIAVLDLIAQA